MEQVRKMLCIFLTDDVLSSKVPQLTLRIAEGDCIVKFQFVEQFEKIDFIGVFIVIGNIVKVTIDRPLGSYHPKHKDIYYPINYGYVEGVIAPDGEEQDAYILGVDEPVEEFIGRIIAIIHRFDDIEEKWVVAPENVSFTKEEIMQQVEFQEKYFKLEIRM